MGEGIERGGGGRDWEGVPGGGGRGIGKGWGWEGDWYIIRYTQNTQGVHYGVHTYIGYILVHIGVYTYVRTCKTWERVNTDTDTFSS